MNIEPIQATCDALCDALVKAGVENPNAEITFRAHSVSSVYLKGDAINDGQGYKFYFTPADGDLIDAIDLAWEFINSMPDPKTAGLRRYQGKLADALDVAREESIDDKYVTPVRGAMDVLSENLLEAPK